jgi:hypothetical protein
LPQLIEAVKNKDELGLVRVLAKVDPNANPLALSESSPSLRKLTFDYNFDALHSIVGALLVNVNDYFNVSRGLSATQIAEVSHMIITDYPYLRIEELVFIFQKAKKDAELFGSLDGSIIFKWIQEYEGNKEEARHQRHLVDKNSDYNIHVSDEQMAQFKVVTDNIREKYERKDRQMSGSGTMSRISQFLGLKKKQ